MRRIACVLALLLAGCRPLQPTPESQFLSNPLAPSAVPGPTGPPFTVRLEGGTPTYPGRWPAMVLIATPDGIIPQERPDVLRVTCGDTTRTETAGYGSVPIWCDFASSGDYRVSVLVTGTAGFTASDATAVQVIPRTVTVH